MSEIPEESLSYQAVVAEYYLGLRGAGLLLSPLDAELVADWERRGLPLAVVCRGQRRGLEEWPAGRPPGAAPPRSLRAVRFAVEEEWRAYRQGRVGSAPPPGDEAAAARQRLAAARAHLEEAMRASEALLREGYREALETLAERGRGASGLRDAEAALVAADGMLLHTWLASLAGPERAALGPRCRLLAGPRGRRTRPTAYRETLRHHLFDAARRAGVLCLRGSV
jgi:hypothetical protein